MLKLFSQHAAPGGFLLSPTAPWVFSLGGEVLVQQHNQLGWPLHSSDIVPVLTSEPCHWQTHLWARLALFSPFSAVEVRVFLIVCSPRSLCSCVCTCQRFCVPSSSVCLTVVPSAGSDSVPSKLRILLPLCKLLKPDVRKELCYEALLWADFIPWLEWWAGPRESWRKSPRGFKPIRLS